MFAKRPPVLMDFEDAYGHNYDQISKRMEELNVLPSKMSKYGEDDNLSYGNLIAIIEKNEPIPDVHEEYNDVDNYQYIHRIFFEVIYIHHLEIPYPKIQLFQSRLLFHL
mgnify:CR=1 FL=1